MRTLRFACLLFCAGCLCAGYPWTAFGQQTPGVVVVKPKPFDGVLVNPGVGFTTFQRFNGDSLNAGTKWTEGFPIDYQPDHGTLENKDFPATTIAYFRVYWRFIEPQEGSYRWDLIDKALQTARARHQTLMLRIAPYGSTPESDVPAWYRQITHEVLAPAPPRHGEPAWAMQRPANEPAWEPFDPQWMVNPMNPAYVHFFGEMIRALGDRYDGDPDLNLVDISIVGPWGEGSGTDMLTQPVREALMDSYLDSFHRTPLVIQPTDPKTVGYALSKANVGWRADCLGDMGGFSKTWNHMTDRYPESIIEDGLADAWKKAPVSMEACWVMQSWENNGWDIHYIIDQAIRWHVSSFNAKSSAVPKDLWPEVNRWLKHMGYRYALRRITYPATVGPSRKLAFTSWWENDGNAPCYQRFPLALRLTDGTNTAVMATDADIRTWMPGNNLYNGSVFIPANLPDGTYHLSVAIVDPDTRQPQVKLAIEGMDPEGWYGLGDLTVHQSLSANP
jgi:Domain of unknown function (DUF4832)/Beta-galactosidase